MRSFVGVPESRGGSSLTGGGGGGVLAFAAGAGAFAGSLAGASSRPADLVAGLAAIGFRGAAILRLPLMDGVRRWWPLASFAGLVTFAADFAAGLAGRLAVTFAAALTVTRVGRRTAGFDLVAFARFDLVTPVPLCSRSASSMLWEHSPNGDVPTTSSVALVIVSRARTPAPGRGRFSLGSDGLTTQTSRRTPAAGRSLRRVRAG